MAVSALSPQRTRLDTILTVSVWTLLIAVLAFGAYFAYTVKVTTDARNLASPAARAVELVRKTVEENPNSPDVRVRLAQTMFAAGRRSDALKQLKTALELDPENVPAYYTLGVIELADGEADRAERAFLKVIELTAQAQYKDISDKREAAYFYLGEIALEDQRYEDAIGYYKESLRIRRDASDTYLGLARALLGLDQQDEALEQLQIAIAFDPNYAEAQYEIGRIYFDKGDIVNASWHLRAALDASPETDLAATALESLGRHETWMKAAAKALADGELQGALDAARIARAIEPNHVEAAVLHAKVLEAQRETEQAINVYKEALALDSGNAEATQALARLEKPKEQ